MKPFIVEFSTQLFGILLLWGILSISKLRWIDIGFTPNGIIRGIGNGLLFGLVCSIFAYTVECIVSLVSSWQCSLIILCEWFLFN